MVFLHSLFFTFHHTSQEYYFVKFWCQICVCVHVYVLICNVKYIYFYALPRKNVWNTWLYGTTVSHLLIERMVPIMNVSFFTELWPMPRGNTGQWGAIHTVLSSIVLSKQCWTRGLIREVCMVTRVWPYSLSYSDREQVAVQLTSVWNRYYLEGDDIWTHLHLGNNHCRSFTPGCYLSTLCSYSKEKQWILSTTITTAFSNCVTFPWRSK